jgi:hypothetical protein
LGVTNRDRLTVPDVDRRHPDTVEIETVVAVIDGQPMRTGETQNHSGHRLWRRVGSRHLGGRRKRQPDVAVIARANRHVAARRKVVPS